MFRRFEPTPAQLVHQLLLNCEFAIASLDLLGQPLEGVLGRRWREHVDELVNRPEATRGDVKLKLDQFEEVHHFLTRQIKPEFAVGTLLPVVRTPIEFPGCS